METNTSIFRQVHPIMLNLEKIEESCLAPMVATRAKLRKRLENDSALISLLK
jgi:hypothetical protein